MNLHWLYPQVVQVTISRRRRDEEKGDITDGSELETDIFIQEGVRNLKSKVAEIDNNDVKTLVQVAEGRGGTGQLQRDNSARLKHVRGTKQGSITQKCQLALQVI